MAHNTEKKKKRKKKVDQETKTNMWKKGKERRERQTVDVGGGDGFANAVKESECNHKVFVSVLFSGRLHVQARNR
jgi:hypothetical protein